MEETYHVCLMTKSTKNTIGLTIDVSKCAPGLMLQIDFSFFNVESIRGFTSTSEAIYSATSYPLGFPPRSKLPPLDILKNIAITMMNQDEKCLFVRVDKDGTLEISSEYTSTRNNINIIIKTISGDEFSLNVKSEIPNKSVDNIKRDLLLN